MAWKGAVKTNAHKVGSDQIQLKASQGKINIMIEMATGIFIFV